MLKKSGRFTSPSNPLACQIVFDWLWFCFYPRLSLGKSEARLLSCRGNGNQVLAHSTIAWEALWVGHKKEYALSIHSKWVSRTSPIILQRHIKNATTELMQTDYLGFTSQGLQAQHNFLFILMVAWLELHSKFSSLEYKKLCWVKWESSAFWGIHVQGKACLLLVQIRIKSWISIQFFCIN